MNDKNNASEKVIHYRDVIIALVSLGFYAYSTFNLINAWYLYLPIKAFFCISVIAGISLWIFVVIYYCKRLQKRLIYFVLSKKKLYHEESGTDKWFRRSILLFIIGVPFLTTGIFMTTFFWNWRDKQRPTILMTKFAGKNGEDHEEFTKTLHVELKKALRNNIGKEQKGEDREEFTKTLHVELKKAFQHDTGKEQKNDKFLSGLFNGFRTLLFYDYYNQNGIEIIYLPQSITEYQGSTEAKELGKKHKADIVIWGWYIEKPPKTTLCANIQMLNPPKPVRRAFRKENIGLDWQLNWGMESVERDFLVLDADENKSFLSDYRLEKGIVYQAAAICGFAYASTENWEQAVSCFDESRRLIDNLIGRLEKNPKSTTNDSKNCLLAKLQSDKVCMLIRSGYCCLNSEKFSKAFGYFSDAITQGKKARKFCNEKRGECNDKNSDKKNAWENRLKKLNEQLAESYCGRATTYRVLNAFGAAKVDFERAGEYTPQGTHSSEDTEYEPLYYKDKKITELYNLAEDAYQRGRDYFKEDLFAHAQIELEWSSRIFSKLCNEAVLSGLKNKYKYDLARSLLILGEVHRQQASMGLPEHDPHTEGAIESYQEVLNIIANLRKSGVIDKSKLKELYADCLRLKGEVDFAQGNYLVAGKVYDNALKIYEGLEKERTDPNERNKYQNRVADQFVRLGDVYRFHSRIKDVNNQNKRVNLAIEKYRMAAVKLGAGAYLSCPDSDPNELDKEKDNLIKNQEKNENVDFLGNVLTHLAEGYLERVRIRKENKQPPEPNDLEQAVKLLECAEECYGETLVEKKPELRDARAWSLTIYGHGLIRQEKYEDAEKILNEAKEIHEKLAKEKKEEDLANFVWNLFTLAAAQYGQKERIDDAQETLLDACQRLQIMITKKEKIWFSDYLADILEILIEFESLAQEESLAGNIGKVQGWLQRESVRELPEALKDIISMLKAKTVSRYEIGIKNK